MMNQLRLNSLFAKSAVCAAALATFTPNLSQANDDTPFDNVKEIAAPIEAVLIPKGFDNNDNTEIVISGAYPDSCYKVGQTRHEVDNQNKIIRVDVTAYHTENAMCLQYYIPFTEVISLGVLRKGDYKVLVNEAPEEKLPIAIAKTDEQDNFIYANVVSITHQSGSTFELQGILPNSCAILKEIRVLKEDSEVIAVLPIVSFKADCESKEGERLDFLKRFDVSKELKGKKLIHVRSLNGGSVNQVVNF